MTKKRSDDEPEAVEASEVDSEILRRRDARENATVQEGVEPPPNDPNAPPN